MGVVKNINKNIAKSFGNYTARPIYTRSPRFPVNNTNNTFLPVNLHIPQ